MSKNEPQNQLEVSFNMIDNKNISADLHQVIIKVLDKLWETGKDGQGLAHRDIDSLTKNDFPTVRVDFKLGGKSFVTEITPEKALELYKFADKQNPGFPQDLEVNDLNHKNFPKNWLSPVSPTSVQLHENNSHQEHKILVADNGVVLNPSSLQHLDKPYVIQANNAEEIQKARETAKNYIKGGVDPSDIKFVDDKGEILKNEKGENLEVEIVKTRRFGMSKQQVVLKPAGPESAVPDRPQGATPQVSEEVDLEKLMRGSAGRSLKDVVENRVTKLFENPAKEMGKFKEKIKSHHDKDDKKLSHEKDDLEKLGNRSFKGTVTTKAKKLIEDPVREMDKLSSKISSHLDKTGRSILEFAKNELKTGHAHVDSDSQKGNSSVSSPPRSQVKIGTHRGNKPDQDHGR